MADGADAALASAFAAAWARRPSGRTALAVSGGGDSMALLHLVAASGERPEVVTVDHRLRPASAAEAAGVAAAAGALGLPHSTLAWEAAPGGNLQAAAREARYRLIGDWARGRGVAVVATAHTLDDQAETVLLRLARGSGIDGLAAMRETTRLGGLTLFRPLLGIRRGALRRYLRGIGVAWIEDPANADPDFDRVRARAMLESLADLGLTPERLARTAGHAARAADALEAGLDAWCAGFLASAETGEVTLDRAVFRALPEELRLRLAARLLGRVSGNPYRPRFEALAALAADLAGTHAVARTLHGCIVEARDRIALFREPAAVEGPLPLTDGSVLWDRRWRVRAPAGTDPAGLTVAALGEAGCALLGAGERARAPRLAWLTTPAVWRGAELVAAPVAGRAAGWHADLVA